MENWKRLDEYCVRFTIDMSMNLKEDNPDDAYNKAYNFVSNHLNEIFDNVKFSVVDGYIIDEAGNRLGSKID